MLRKHSGLELFESRELLVYLSIHWLMWRIVKHDTCFIARANTYIAFSPRLVDFRAGARQVANIEHSAC